MSRIKLGEVYYSLVKDPGETAGKFLLAQFLNFPEEVVSVSDADIDEAAKLKSRFPVSYADAFAAVLALSRGVPIVTGDPEFKKLATAGLLTLHWLGR